MTFLRIPFSIFPFFLFVIQAVIESKLDDQDDLAAIYIVNIFTNYRIMFLTGLSVLTLNLTKYIRIWYRFALKLARLK